MKHRQAVWMKDTNSWSCVQVLIISCSNAHICSGSQLKFPCPGPTLDKGGGHWKNTGLTLFSPLSLTERPLLGHPYFLNEIVVLAKHQETRVVSLTPCCFSHWISNQYWLLSATSRWNVQNNSLLHILERPYFWVLESKRTTIQHLEVYKRKILIVVNHRPPNAAKVKIFHLIPWKRMLLPGRQFEDQECLNR